MTKNALIEASVNKTRENFHPNAILDMISQPLLPFVSPCFNWNLTMVSRQCSIRFNNRLIQLICRLLSCLWSTGCLRGTFPLYAHPYFCNESHIAIALWKNLRPLVDNVLSICLSISLFGSLYLLLTTANLCKW